MCAFESFLLLSCLCVCVCVFHCGVFFQCVCVCFTGCFFVFLLCLCVCFPGVFQVRVGAGHAFRQLYKNVGSKAVEKIAPYLVENMKGDKAGDAVVDGLMMVLQGCARNTFFYLCTSTLST